MEENTSQIRQPLNLYTFFGYLLPGFFFISLIIIDLDGSKLITDHWKFPASFVLSSEGLVMEGILGFFSTGTISDFKFIPFLLFLLFCYLLGHIISAIASIGIERLLVRKFWKFPSSNLVSEKDPPRYFKDFRQPFNPMVKKELRKASKEIFGFEADREDYYWLFYSYIINKRPHLAARIHHFVNLYGFSRNVCGTFLIYIVFRLIVMWGILKIDLDFASVLILIAFLIMAVFMFLNYLKLFKRQAVDIYFLFLAVHRERKDFMEETVTNK